MLEAQTIPSSPAQVAQEALHTLESLPNAAITVHIGEQELAVPDDVVDLVRSALRQLAEGHRVRLIVDDRELMPQEAAELLNLAPAQYLALLTTGRLPFRPLGPDHRVLRAEVLAHKAERSLRREEAFRILAEEAEKYDLGY